MIQTMPLVTNIRHHEALVRVQDSLQNVQDGLDSGTPTDLVSVDLRDALSLPYRFLLRIPRHGAGQAQPL